MYLSIQASMEEANFGDLRAELAALEAVEARVSAERRHLHRQIDFGYASETARARERELSGHRRELHRRIDALRERLGMPAGPQRASAQTSLDQIAGDSPIRELERIGQDTQHIAAPEDHPHVM
jgi:hypothetical protein